MKKTLKTLGWTLCPHRFAQRYLAEDKGAEIEETIVPVFLSKTAECVDVGANCGRYTVLMSLFSRHVHAFDPNPECVNSLQNLALPNASIYPCALSSIQGISEYFVAVQEGARMSVWGTLERSILEKHPEVETFEVFKSTLDSLCNRVISFIKIDVEGHEIDVLEGGRKLISEQRPIFMVEAEDRHRKGAVQQVKDFFDQYSYQCFFILDRKIFPFSFFDSEYQNPAILQSPVPRSQMRYVNNFIFIPSSLDTESMLEKMRTRLNSTVREYALQ